MDAVARRLGGGAGGYRPVSFEEVGRWMGEKDYRPVDHHGRD